MTLSWSSSLNSNNTLELLEMISILNLNNSAIQFIRSLNHLATGHTNINLCLTLSFKKDLWWRIWSRTPIHKSRKWETLNLSNKKNLDYSKANLRALRKWLYNLRQLKLENHLNLITLLKDFWENSLKFNRKQVLLNLLFRDQRFWVTYRFLTRE